MPWYFNVNPMVIRAKLVDGSNQAFMPRTPTYISRENISAEVTTLINKRILAFRGDDPRDVKIPPPVAVMAKAEVRSEVMQVLLEPESATSSSTHESYDKVLAPSEPALDGEELEPSDLTKDDELEGKKRRGRRR